jgi:uncharacterized protein involved in exopolysaccharide biosynthesis
MDSTLTLSDIIGVLRRRWLLLILPVAVGVPLAIGIAMLLPTVYSSTALIVIESQQIPSEMAQSTVSQPAAERIQLIQQRLLTRANMLDIAEQYNVFRNRTGMTPTDIVREMRQSTTIRTTGSTDRRNRDVTGVSISFRATNATVAAQVANELVTRIISENVQQRSERAGSTLRFFNEEVARLSRELDASSERMTRFRRENSAVLPQVMPLNIRELEERRERQFMLEDTLETLQLQRSELEENLEIGVVASDDATPLERELGQLRNELVTQRALLTDTHPTIRRLNARIAAVETAIAEGTGAATGRTDEVAGATGAAARTMARLEALDREIDNVLEESERNNSRITQLEEYQQRAAIVQVELANMERAHETLQIEYRAAVMNEASAETGERLEVSQQAERLEVIEQAIPENEPVAPNRRLIVMAGTAGSGGLGIGLMLLAELLNQSLRTVRDFERQLEIRPIAVVPYIQSESQRRYRQVRNIVLVAAVVIGVPVGVFLFDQYVMPLSAATQRILEMLRLEHVIDVLRVTL